MPIFLVETCVKRQLAPLNVDSEIIPGFGIISESTLMLTTYSPFAPLCFR